MSNKTKFIVVSATLIAAASLIVTGDSPLVEYKCGHDDHGIAISV
jgi:hypothetical protein